MATESINTPTGRMAYPYLFAPRTNEKTGKTAYEINVVIPKTADLMPLRKIIRDAIVEKWGEDKAKWPPNLRRLDLKSHLSVDGKDGFPLRDGDESLDKTTGEPRQGYEGCVYFCARTIKYPPGVVDHNVQRVLDPKQVFGGRRCNVQVNAYGYDNESRGVSIGLQNVQILPDDGTRWGGAPPKAEAAFKPVSDGSDDPSNYPATGTDDDGF